MRKLSRQSLFYSFIISFPKAFNERCILFEHLFRFFLSFILCSKLYPVQYIKRTVQHTLCKKSWESRGETPIRTVYSVTVSDSIYDKQRHFLIYFRNYTPVLMLFWDSVYMQLTRNQLFLIIMSIKLCCMYLV
jgi:hypothetical protein